MTQKKKKKVKKDKSILEAEIMRIIQATLKTTIDTALNDIFKD